MSNSDDNGEPARRRPRRRNRRSRAARKKDPADDDNANAGGGAKNKKRSEFASALRSTSLAFLDHVNSSPDVRSRSSDRSEVGVLFEEWRRSSRSSSSSAAAAASAADDGGTRYHCSRVMTFLRQSKLLQSKRRGDVVITTFALSSTPGDYPDVEERRTAREEAMRRRRALEADKGGVAVERLGSEFGGDILESSSSSSLVPVGHESRISFVVVAKKTSEGEEEDERRSVLLREVTLAGAGRRHFAILRGGGGGGGDFPRTIEGGGDGSARVELSFRSPGAGIFRAIVAFQFVGGESGSGGDGGERRGPSAGPFRIVRYVTVRSGDSVLHDILRPTSPYKKRRPTAKIPADFVPAPPQEGRKGSAFVERLPNAGIPYEVTAMIEQGELDSALDAMVRDVDTYDSFWKRLLWASEAQAKLDVTLFDMTGASMVPRGRFLTLAVPGLAEGRPSVLRGDTVLVKFAGRGWKGAVQSTRLEEAVLEFDEEFHRKYRRGLDTVDVRFTFSRTTFRTSHEGCSRAPESLGPSVLFPDARDLESIRSRGRSRVVSPNLRWANRELNAEQREAVRNVVQGSARPLPYIIFGPPGTGKTTTVVEAVYQLSRHPDRPKILLVAPSNDASDVLVEKLSSYFSPSQMRRLIAYSRTLDQVPPVVRPYVKDGSTTEETVADIEKAAIVVSTVNLAARLFYNGVPRGLFDVVCVDEAGHATEPEVVAVASTLLNCDENEGAVGQLILAGDPRQLGPVVTSRICEKHGLGVSFMERLSNREVYGRDEDRGYPSNLLTKLVRNYRSHPSIIKLPNEMFYDDELLLCGDRFKTHSMARWEHLPAKGFPVLFHAVSGENLREANSPSWFNPQEATEVVNYVDLLVKQTTPGVNPSEIGVITPYARQAQKIRLALKTRDLSDVKVGSVETFQGQERRCIIVSTVRAEQDFLEHDKRYNLGFVSNKKRFNVAVTRAAALLIVIGQPQVLATDKDLWLPLLKMCKENNSWVGEEWDADEDPLKTEDDLLAAADEIDGDEEDWVVEGMNRPEISRAMEQEGVGFVDREE